MHISYEKSLNQSIIFSPEQILIILQYNTGNIYLLEEKFLDENVI